MSEFMGKDSSELVNMSEDFTTHYKLLGRYLDHLLELAQRESVMGGMNLKSENSSGVEALIPSLKHDFSTEDNTDAREVIDIINKMLEELSRTVTRFQRFDIQRQLLLSAQERIADIEVDKEHRKLKDQSRFGLGFKRAIVRSISVLAIAFTLFGVGYLQSKIPELSFPDLPLIRL